MLKERVEKVLASIRPNLEADGGNIDLIDVDEKSGIVKVRLVGACSCCPMSQMTLKNGVEAAIKREIQEIKIVESV